MLIFNTFNIINLKEKTHYIKSDDLWIHHYNPSHYKLSENFIPYCRLLLSNKKKMVKLSLPSSIKLLPWQPDMQYLDIFKLSF